MTQIVEGELSIEVEDVVIGACYI